MAESRGFTALPWAAWFSVTAVVVMATNNIWLLAAVAVGCWVTAHAIGGSLAGVGRAVAGFSFAVAAVWVVLGVLIHREGLGGPVVWILPTWSVESSGEFGGAVTTGQLHFAVARGVQGVAIVAMLGLLARAVPGAEWMRLAHVAWGRFAPAFGPLLFLGGAHVEQRRDQVAALRSGFSSPRMVDAVADVTERSRTMAAGPSSARQGSRGRGITGLALVVAIALWWAVGAITAEGLPLLGPLASGVNLNGIERTTIALGALTFGGAVLHGGLPRPGVADVIPVVSAVVVAAAWYGRDLTGDGAAVAVDFGGPPSAPLVLLVSLAALPLLVFAAGGRR